MLLIQRKHNPCKGLWAFPGGFMNIDETAEAAAVRELREERVVTIAYFAEMERPVKVKGNDDAAQARWFPLDELPPLAFDHDEILMDARLIWEEA